MAPLCDLHRDTQAMTDSEACAPPVRLSARKTGGILQPGMRATTSKEQNTD